MLFIEYVNVTFIRQHHYDGKKSRNSILQPVDLSNFSNFPCNLIGHNIHTY